ncbi:selenium cofactor biosynthesis protein YqeC [Pseudocitrobacter cyperus]|uniref:Selenium cofactor biosynthesis protein YqeC n=1 Tax=Pseudocitrobacter cyperus TaxID=3112843 RepID=A0ABV0HJK0_9ENTR
MDNITEDISPNSDVGGLHKPLVISVVGAGGKTSTIFWLANLFRAGGRRVLITTTTNMFLPDVSYPRLFCREPGALPPHILMQPIQACFASWKAVEGKVRGFSSVAIDRLATRPECDIILVEADGAHGLPLKAPDVHEPCIPQSSRCVIAVMGGQMLGQKTGPEHVHRWPLFTKITGLKADEPLSVNDLIRLIQHPEGAFKGAPEGCRRIWLINRFSQFDITLIQPQLLQPLRQGDIDVIWLGAVQETLPITHRFVR